MAGKGFTDVRPELFTAAGAGAEPTGGQVAVTKPLKGGGTAMAAGAKELPLLLPPDVHADPELGWCVRLVPPGCPGCDPRLRWSTDWWRRGPDAARCW